MEITDYVAASLDGYIATPDGKVDWLSVVDQPGEDYGYADFLKSVEVLFMGSKTYEQVLGFGDWPYPDKTTYVFSKRDLKPVNQTVKIISMSPDLLVEQVNNAGVKHAWLVGGASLASSFRKYNRISKFIISIIPIVLGEGVRMLKPAGTRESMELIESKTYEMGLVQLTYVKPASTPNSLKE